MDGPLAPVACVSQLEHEDCELSDTCELKWLWQDVRDAISDMLESVTFQDIIEHHKKVPGSGKD
jgi:DNA-binding IscR family transcriptional regulator